MDPEFRILPSSSKNSKKNLESYPVLFCDFFLTCTLEKNYVNIPQKVIGKKT
jgi:hypothetical protein